MKRQENAIVVLAAIEVKRFVNGVNDPKMTTFISFILLFQAIVLVRPLLLIVA